MAYSYGMYGIQQPVNGLISVTGIEAARAYPLPPNSSMPMFDADKDVMYVKTTDGAGFPTVKAYEFNLVEAPTRGADYVSREEFNALVERLDGKEEKNAEQFVSKSKWKQPISGSQSD